MKRNYEERFAAHLAKARGSIKEDCDAMLARHSAAGRLQSGSTLISAVSIWTDRTSEAVTAALAEFATLIEQRGTEWGRAMAAVASGIDTHRKEARADLAGVFRAANPRGGAGGSADQAVDARLDNAARGLREQAAAFRDGWTSPRPRSWNERHPVAFAILMALIGSAITLAGQAIVG
jgi:hypothetical protein